MNFARHQEQAERAGRRLLALHALATVAVVVAVDAVATLLWHLAFGAASAPPRGFHATNVAVVVGLVAGGAWLETSRLRADGARIARRLGAVPLDTLGDPLHRRLQNLLEEVAIAARIGVPRAFVIEDEPTINALTAGMDRNQAVVVVTRGALARLTRDELQGVVAHEIAHVVNGDVRLNTRLVGLNHGLQLVSLYGRSLLAQAGAAARGKSLGAAGALFALPLGAAGVVLGGIGLLGAVAARAIQAGVGRQREYLADAQAVAFTRHRDGLGGALRKVAGQTAQLRRETGDARLDARRECARRHPYLHNVSPLLLVGSTASRRWFDTHPPLRERVRRIYGRPMDAIAPREIDEPQRREPDLPALAFALSGAPLRASGEAEAPSQEARPVLRRRAGDAPRDAREAGVAAVAEVLRDESADDTGPWLDTRSIAARAAAVAAPSPARSTPAALPHEDRTHAAQVDSGASAAALRLVQATREPASAAALVIALIESNAPAAPRWGAGWECAATRHGALRAAIAELAPQALRSLRWPLMELAVARLRPLSRGSRDALLATARELVLADDRMTLREWIYFSLLRLRLAPQSARPRLPVLAGPIDARSIRVLFGVVAHCAHVSETKADRAANAAIRLLELVPIGGSAGPLTLDALERAVQRAALLPPLARPLLVRQMVALLPHDADTDVRDFLRLLCVAIDCPPPELPPRRSAAHAHQDSGQPISEQAAR